MATPLDRPLVAFIEKHAGDFFTDGCSRLWAASPGCAEPGVTRSEGTATSLRAVTATCTMCGRSSDAHNRHVRFRLPDPVLTAPDQESTPGTWMSHEDAAKSVMKQVPGVGPFVRVLLPVALLGGDTVTFGVWLGVHPDDLQRTFREWWAPTYPDLVLEGRIANDVQPWGLLARPATARVRNPDKTPYLTSSTDGLTERVLTQEWAHAEVLDALS